MDKIKIIKLTTHEGDCGFFREIFRFPEQFEGIPVGQLSHSMVQEGAVKAWHGHVCQSQWNYVVSGQLQVALFDNRKDSTSYKELMEFVVGDDEEEPSAYFFSPGILQAYKCVKGPVQIIYVTSGVYDLEDEVRFPYEFIEQNSI